MSEIPMRSTRSADPTFDAMEARQRAARIRPQLGRALRSLRPDERKIFLDHEEGGVSFDALARRDRTTADALRNMAFRARKQLRMCLSRDLLVFVALAWMRLRWTASKAINRIAIEGSSIAFSQIASAVFALGVVGTVPHPGAQIPARPVVRPEAAAPATRQASGAPLTASYHLPGETFIRSRGTVGGTVGWTHEQTERRDYALEPEHSHTRVEVRKPDGSPLIGVEYDSDCSGYASYPLPDPSPVRTSC